MENSSYTIYEKVLSQREENETEFEETLPEYLPGIEKVIFAKAIPVVRYERFDGKTLNVGVRTVFKVVFASDHKKQLKCMSCVRDYEFSFDSASGDFAEDSVSECGVGCTFVSAKAVGQRKLSIRARISLAATVWSGTTEEPFDAVDSEDLICLRRKISAVNMTKVPCDELRITKELELGSGMPAVEEIVDASADMCVCRVKCTENGGTAYGSAVFRALYRTSDDTYVTLTEDIPFEAYLGNCPKDGTVNVNIFATSLSADTMTDNYGENRIISVGITADVSAICRENTEAYLCEDAFCRNFACSVEVKPFPEKRAVGTLEESFKVSGSIGTSAKDITEIIEATANIVSANAEYMDGKTVLSGKMSVFVLGAGAEGDIVSVEGIMPYNAVFSENGAALENAEYDTSVCVLGTECAVSQGEIVCNAEICARSTVTESTKTAGVSAVDIDESAPCSKPDNELVICYPSKSDTLWSVSKKYKVAPEAISAANKMTGNSFGTKTVIIPMKA